MSEERRRECPRHKFEEPKEAFGLIDLEVRSREDDIARDEEFQRLLRAEFPEREGVSTKAGTEHPRTMARASTVCVRSNADW